MTLRSLFLFLIFGMISGCRFSIQQIPLPLDEAEFPKPIQKPLKLSDPKKIEWKVVGTDSLKQGEISAFNIDKIPSQPFNLENFKPLTNPAVMKSFDYNSFPDTVFDIDRIPSEPLIWKTSLLGSPKLVSLITPKVRAESYFTSFQYSGEQGLPGTTLQAIYLSKGGVLWLKTDAELCILINESLEILPFNYGVVNTITEDHLGQIWVRTRDNGIFVIDRKKGIQKQFLAGRGIDVLHDKNGFGWITSRNDGLYQISPDQKTIKHITRKNGLSTDTCLRLMEDKDHRIWIGNRGNGIDVIDLQTKKIRKLTVDPNLPDNRIFSLLETKSGEIYAANVDKGIDIINIKNQTIKHIDSAQGFPKEFIFDMVEDNENQIWTGSDANGVNIISKNGDSICHIREGLPDTNISNIKNGSNGQVLVCSESGGLNIFPDASRVAHHISKKDGLLSKDVWGLLEDDKHRIWIATYEGVNIITTDKKILKLLPNMYGKNRTTSIIQAGPGEIIMGGSESGLYLISEYKKTIENISIKEGLPSNQISVLYRDRKELIWMGTNDGFLIQFDPKKRTVRYFRIIDSAGIISNQISGITEDSSGKFWISTLSGLYILDLSENMMRHYSTEEGISDKECGTVFKDSKNRLWVPTEKGMNLLDLAKKTNTVFTETNGLPSPGIYSVLENNGRIYAGTANGLTEFEESAITSSSSIWNLQTYGRQQGFGYLNFNGNTQLTTHSGEYWWGIQDGVTMMNGNLIKPDSFSVSPTVTGIDLLGKSQYFTDLQINDLDTLWNVIRDSFYLRSSFNSLNSDKQKGIQWDSLSDSFFPVNLSLPHGRNYIRFHFTNTLPQNAGDYKYRYILDGVDEKWSPVTQIPVSENYNNISPGDYTFRISARKNLGPWSEPSVYQIRIRPPWWQSWWAELIYFLAIIGLIRGWVGYRSRQLLKENVLLEQKVIERTRALSTSLENLHQAQGQLIQAEKMASLGELTAGIAHEIQNPLNFVNNFSEVNTELIDDINKTLDKGDVLEAKEMLKDIEMNMGKITFHGKRADAIVKGMLLHSRASSQQKIPTNVNALADEYLRLSYHGLRAKDKSFNAQFHLNLDDKIEEVLLVQQDIGRVFLNIFNNAFYAVSEKKKIAPDDYEPTVDVNTKRKKDSIEIRIRDNGLGISKKVLEKIYQPFFTTKPPGQGTGLGLSLSYDIITKAHGGKIDVFTKEGEFSEFVVELPTGLKPNA